eukprot:1194246-Prorocentrum_minimum.AAC.5
MGLTYEIGNIPRHEGQGCVPITGTILRWAATKDSVSVDMTQVILRMPRTLGGGPPIRTNCQCKSPPRGVGRDSHGP